jgi:hypothetical protein
MRYIDSSIRSAEETVAFWMHEAAQAGIRELRFQNGYFTLGACLGNSRFYWREEGESDSRLA